jgi:ribosomal protein L3 glutamine methyltransferase
MTDKPAYQEAARELITLRDFLRFSLTMAEKANIFLGHGTDDLATEMTFIIQKTLRLPPEAMSYCWEAKLTTSEKTELLTNLHKRIEERVPAAYVVNEANFAGLEFYVDERVIIPRSPIAELIEARFEPWLNQSPRRILDLCTGSGCIAIACAYEFPFAKVDAVDLSENAIAVATKNVEDFGMQDRVQLLQGDLLDPVKDNQYDLIVCNPPYVSSQEYNSLPTEYHFEPKMALEAENNGLAIVDRLLKQAEPYLSFDGILVVEVGDSEMAVKQAYPDMPFTWLEFANGGSGVFLLDKKSLGKFQS